MKGKVISVLDNVFNALNYKIAIIVATLLTVVPYIHGVIGGYVKFVLAFGIVTVLYLTVKNGFKFLFKDKLSVLLILFCVSYLITCIINRGEFLSSNLSSLAYMAVSFSLFFIFTVNTEKEKLIKEYKILACVIIAFTAVYSILNLFIFAFNISGSYVVNTVVQYYGVKDNRLWGIYNANTNSTLCVISVIFSLGLAFSKPAKKRIVKILCIANIILQFIGLVLTGSRASNYVLYLLSAVFAFVYSVKSKVSFKKIGSGLTGVISAVVCMLVLFAGTKVVNITAPYIPKIASNINIDVSSSFNDENNKDDLSDNSEENAIINNLNRNDISDKEVGILNGRTRFWKAGLKTFADHPLFGISREKIYTVVREYLNDPVWDNHLRVGGVHNIYLTVLISSGIVGFLLLAVFAIFVLIKLIKAIIKMKDTNSEFLAGCLLLLMFFITELVEGRILYQVSFFNMVFWCFLGIAYAQAKSILNKADEK